MSFAFTIARRRAARRLKAAPPRGARAGARYRVEPGQDDDVICEVVQDGLPGLATPPPGQPARAQRRDRSDPGGPADDAPLLLAAVAQQLRRHALQSTADLRRGALACAEALEQLRATLASDPVRHRQAWHALQRGRAELVGVATLAGGRRPRCASAPTPGRLTAMLGAAGTEVCPQQLQENTMPKGQQRGNKEAKKPKQTAPSVPLPASGPVATQPPSRATATPSPRKR